MKLADSTFLATLIFVIVAGIVGKSLGGGETIFVAGNLGIVAGYSYTAVFIAPYFKVDRGTRQAAVLFFFACAGTHLELVYHALADRPFDYGSWHMVMLHAIQFGSIARFVYGLRRTAIVDRGTLRDLADAAEKDHPPTEAIGKAREALGDE